MVPASSHCMAALCMGHHKDCNAQPAGSQPDSHLPYTVSYNLCQCLLYTRKVRSSKQVKSTSSLSHTLRLSRIENVDTPHKNARKLRQRNECETQGIF